MQEEAQTILYSLHASLVNRRLCLSQASLSCGDQSMIPHYTREIEKLEKAERWLIGVAAETAARDQLDVEYAEAVAFQ